MSRVRPRSGWFATLAVLIGATAFIGCGQEPSPPRPGDKDPPVAEVKLETIKKQQWEDAFKALRGKVVVLDVWGEF